MTTELCRMVTARAMIQWDASQIKQPGWDHVFAAFIEGAREANANQEAGEADFQRAADGYTKRVFEELDPESERRLREGDFVTPSASPETGPEHWYSMPGYENAFPGFRHIIYRDPHGHGWSIAWVANGQDADRTAQLIVSAPEMLAALQEADWAIAGLLKELRVDPSAWNDPLPANTLAKVRAAIAKATESAA